VPEGVQDELIAFSKRAKILYEEMAAKAAAEKAAAMAKKAGAVAIMDIDTTKKIKVLSNAEIDKEIAHLETLLKKDQELYIEVDKVVQYLKSQLQGEGSIGNTVIAGMLEKNTPTFILLKHMSRALQVNREFNTGLFAKGLYAAAANPKTFSITRLSNNALSTKINLNETAGSISDWGAAIWKIRSELINRKYNESGPGRPFTVTSAEVASSFWENMYYKPAREGGKATRRKFNRKTKTYEDRDVKAEVIADYWNTMTKRLTASGKPAPYWEILDKGIVGLKGIEGGGGKAYPVPTPTHFVQATIDELASIYKKERKVKTNLFDKDLQKTQKLATQLQADIILINNEIDRLRKIRASAAIPSGTSPGQVFHSRVLALGRPVDEAKVLAIMTSLNARQLGEIYVTAECRVEITAKGGPRARIRISSIIRDFGL